MGTLIKHLHLWLRHHPRLRQWIWFWGLWFGGLGMALALSSPLKWLIQRMS